MKKILCLFLLMLNLTFYSQEVGLIADFPFNGNNLSNVSGPVFSQLGQYNYVADRNQVDFRALSRSTNFVEFYFPANSVPTGNSARSVSLWFKATGSSNGSKTLFSQGTSSTLSLFAIGFEKDPVQNTSSLFFGADANIQNTPFTIVDNVWYNYVVTTNSSGVVRQYVNGALIGTYQYPINTSTNGTCILGGFFNGALDDLKVYNREITATEASNLFNFNSTLVPPPDITFTNLTSSAITNTTATVSVTLANVCPGSQYKLQYSRASDFLSTTILATFSTGGTAGVKSHDLTGLFPGEIYYFRFFVSPGDACNTAEIVSPTATFTTTSPPVPVVISFTNLISSNITTNSATVSATLANVCPGATYKLQYSTASDFSFNVLEINYATGGVGGVKNHNITTGIQANTNYFYRFVAMPNAACNASIVISTSGGFTTPNSFTINPIAEYNFDNVLTNINGSLPFSTNANNQFTLDRFQVANKAYKMNGFSVAATIPTLPVGNSSRTISIWIKPETVNADNIIFTYGNPAFNDIYGASFSPTGIFNFSFSSNVAFSTTVSPNIWKHIVYTYDRNGFIARIYVDGDLVSTASQPFWLTSVTTTFNLGNTLGGSSQYLGAIDDLKIFDRAITATEVSNLFTYNSLTPTTTPTFTQVAPICAGTTLAALPLTSINGFTGTWSPPLNNTATTLYTFTPTAGQSATTATMTITVNTVAAPTASAQSFCTASTVANLVATGSDLKWYAALTGGTQLASTTALATGTYFVSQTVGACESNRTSVAVTVGSASAPTAQAQTVAAGSTIANLVATGTSLKWYATLTGGTQLASTTALATGTYFVSQTVGTCESTRTAVAVTVNAPVLPITFSNLTSSAITSTTATVSVTLANVCTGATYNLQYSRFQNFAQPVINLNNFVAGTAGVKTHDLTGLTADITYYFRFYVSPNQACNTAEIISSVSSFTTTNVSNTIPTFAQVAPICSGGTLAALPTMSTNGITGTWAPALNNTTTTTYTFTPTAGQSATTATMTITVNSSPAPTAQAQTVATGSTIANLVATGTSLKWYATLTGGTQLASTTALATGTYFVSQTVGTCESTRTAVAVTVNATVSIIAFSNLSSSAITNTTATVSVTLANVCTGATYRIQYSTSSVFTTANSNVVFDNLISANVTNGVNNINLTGLSPNTEYFFRFYASPQQACNDIEVVSASGSFFTTSGTTITPTFAQVAPICSGGTLAALPNTSTNGITGSWSPALNNTATTTYTFTPTAGQNATTATMTITVNSSPAPTAQAQTVATGSTIANLVATGTSLKWYATLTGGTQLASTTALATGTYFVSQTVGTCESTRTSVAVTVTSGLPITFSNVTSSAVTHTSATVSVTLANVCIGSFYNLEYSTSSNFSTGNVVITYATGDTNGVKNHNLTGIAANTAYYFRFYSDIGEACNTVKVTSASAAFNTPNITTPIQFSNLTSSAITATTAVVSVTMGSVCYFSSYQFQFSTSSNFTTGVSDTSHSTASTSGIKTHALAGLNPNTIYYYRFYAAVGQACNNIQVTSATGSFTTTNTVGPEIVFSNLTSSAITNTSAKVSVTLSNVCSGAEYRMQYSTTSGFAAGTVDNLYTTNVITGVKTHILTGLVPNTIYYYRFYAAPGQACNAAQIVSATASFTTLGATVTPTFTQVPPICSGATLAALPNTSTNGITGTWAPALSNTATTTYTFTPTAGQNATTATMTITVNPNVTPTFAAVAPICSGGTLAALPTTSTNGIAGSWSPALNNTATTTYTFTPTAGQCATTTTRVITVNPSVTPTFAAVAPICSGGTLAALPTTSTNGIAGTWSPALNNTVTTTYTFTPTAGQCATTTTRVITVNPSVTPTFAAVAPICSGGTLAALPTTSTNGIAGTWSPALNNTATTTYTFTPTAGQCATTTTRVITVNPNVTPTFVQVAPICSGTTASPLLTTSTNGITGSWSPAFNNTATTTYTFTPTAGQCATGTASMVITVSSSVTPTFTQISPVCLGSASSAMPTTSNNGVVGTWSPASINTAVTSSYVFTPNAGQCATATASMTITVSPNVTPTFAAVAPICSGGTLAALPTTSTNGIAGTWSPALNNTTTTTYTFTPTSGQCATTATLSITVNPSVTPTFAAVAPICSGGTLAALPTTSTNGIAGTWSPALNNTATTTYTFTPTAGQCATTTTRVITVNPNVTPTFAAVAPICSGGTLAALPTTSTNGIAGTWSPALNNTTTTTYTFTPTAGQCATTATTTVVVNTVANPTGAASQTFVQGATLASIVVSPTNVIWYATNANALAGSNPLPSTTVLVNLTTYYAVNVVGSCRSNPLAVAVSITLNTDEYSKISLVLYPNPVIDVLNIDTIAEIKLVEIYNIQGQKVKSTNQKQINVSDLANAMYLIKIQDSDNRITLKKFVKKQ